MGFAYLDVDQAARDRGAVVDQETPVDLGRLPRQTSRREQFHLLQWTLDDGRQGLSLQQRQKRAAAGGASQTARMNAASRRAKSTFTGQKMPRLH